jgi:hypothetical protein
MTHSADSIESIDLRIKTLECDKIRAETAKIATETAELSRPWWRRPAYLISLIPIVVASITLGQLLATGYYDNVRRGIEIERKSAEAEKSRLIVENEGLEREKATLEGDRQELQNRISRLHDQENALIQQSNAISTLSAARVEVQHRGATLFVRFSNYDHEYELSTLISLLARLQQLTWISFTSTDFNDSHLAQLKSITALQSLYLDGTQITDDGLAHLATLDNLTFLSVNSTQLTDRARIHLGSLSGLKTLQIAGTKISPSAVARIREQLPDCHITGESTPMQ